MRKFMKGCGITAIVMLVLGLILTGMVTLIKGRTYLNDFIYRMSNGRFDLLMDRIENWDDSEYAFEGYDIEDYSIYNETHAVNYADYRYEFDPASAGKLDMNLAGCSFEIYSSGDGSFYVESLGGIKLQAYQEDGTVYIKGTNSHNSLDDFEDTQVTLYVPEDMHFEEARVEMGAGNMYVESLNADKLSLNVGAGQIEGNGMAVDTLSAKVGAGSINLYELTARTIEAKVDLGHLYVGGAVSGDVNCESSMGSVDLELEGSSRDFNYDVKCASGNVELDGENFSGVDYNKKVDNGADKKMTLTTSLGSIMVYFY